MILIVAFWIVIAFLCSRNQESLTTKIVEDYGAVIFFGLLFIIFPMIATIIYSK